jgi:hypothetical protein
MWHNARAPVWGRSFARRRRQRVKMRPSGAFRRWPAGLLVEVAAYLLLMGAVSLVALFVAGMA